MTLRAAQKLLIKKKKYILVLFLFDILFIVLSLLVASHFYDRILDQLITIVQALGSNIGQISEESLGQLALQHDFYESYQSLIKLSVGLFFSLFFIYLVTQGIAWFVTQYMVKRLRFKTYALRFFQASVAWAIVTVVIAFVFMRVSYANVVTLGSLVDQRWINGASVFVFAAVFYFVSVTYALIGRHHAFFALKRAFIVKKEYLMMFGLLILGGGAASWLIAGGVGLSSLLAVVVGILLLLAVFSFYRVALVLTKINRKN